MKLYVIYDRAAEECGPVMDCKNDAIAIRAFKQALKSSVGGNDEYWMYCVGELNNQTMDMEIKKYRVEIDMRGDIEDGK